MDTPSTKPMLIVRYYQPDDLDACHGLWVELTNWHRRIYESPGIGGPDPGRQFNELLARVGPDHIWVAELDGDVVGLAGLIMGEDQAELEPLVVVERHRGLGIGRRLAEAVIEAARARGIRQLTTRPVARNDHAIRLFHALGFDVLGQIELLMDLRSMDRQRWRMGERVAGVEFRV